MGIAIEDPFRESTDYTVVVRLFQSRFQFGCQRSVVGYEAAATSIQLNVRTIDIEQYSKVKLTRIASCCPSWSCSEVRSGPGRSPGRISSHVVAIAGRLKSSSEARL